MIDRGRAEPELCLLGDIGGTNARFCLYDSRRDEYVKERILSTAGYTTPETAIEAYLQVAAARRPVRAALAVASPVTGDRIRLTNQNWEFSTAGLRDAVGFERLEVVNDFAAQALAVPRLSPRDVVTLSGGSGLAGEVFAVLGPGTGLGVAGLVKSGGGWKALPGEGGHVTLPAVDGRQQAVIDWLRQRHGHVSAERVISGQGLVALYEALCGLTGQQPEKLTPAQVTQKGEAGSDQHCAQALALFFEFLGIVAGNLVLTLGATGGLYLAGGILPRLRESLRGSGFLSGFVAKGRFREYLEAVAVHLVIRENPAFLGLAQVLKD